MRYADFAPTTMDCRGLALPDRQDWLVAPVSITRDTPKGRDTANWESLQAILDGDNIEYEIHRFGHWGPGWFEIVLVHPDGAACLESIEAGLADYPVLDDEKVSEHEHEATIEAWDGFYAREFCRELAQAFELADNLPDAELVESLDPSEELWFLCHRIIEREGLYWEHGSEGASLDIARLVEATTSDDLDPYRKA